MYDTIFEDMQLRVHQLMTHLQISQSKLDLLCGATADGDDLQLLSGYILNGCPIHQTTFPCPSDLSGISGMSYTWQMAWFLLVSVW